MKQKGTKLLIINTSVWAVMAVYTPFVAAYYTQCGLSTQQIGILLAIGPLMAILIQPQWARVSDATGKRRGILMLAALGSGVTVLLYTVKAGFYAFIIATVCFTAFQTAILPLSDALIIQTAHNQGSDFAKIRMGGTIGYAIVALVLGNFIETGSSAIFVLSAGAFLLLGGIVRLLPPDEKKMRSTDAAAQTGKGGKVFRTKEIYLVLFLALLLQVGLSVCSSFYSVYVIQLGYGQSVVGLSSCISALSELPILYFAHKLLKRYGAIPLLLFSVFMTSLRLILSCSGFLPLMLASQLLQSVTYMTSYYSCATYISENVLSGKISQGQSYLTMVQTGLGTILGTVLGGYITGITGIPKAFMLIAALITFAGILCLCVYRNQRRNMSWAEKRH